MKPLVHALMGLLLIDVFAWALIAHSIAGALFWTACLVFSPKLIPERER